MGQNSTGGGTTFMDLLPYLIQAGGSIGASATQPNPFQPRIPYTGDQSPSSMLGRAQGNAQSVFDLLFKQLNTPISLPDATVGELPSFFGGGLPMNIGVRGGVGALGRPPILDGSNATVSTPNIGLPGDATNPTPHPDDNTGGIPPGLDPSNPMLGFPIINKIAPLPRPPLIGGGGGGGGIGGIGGPDYATLAGSQVSPLFPQLGGGGGFGGNEQVGDYGRAKTFSSPIRQSHVYGDDNPQSLLTDPTRQLFLQDDTTSSSGGGGGDEAHSPNVRGVDRTSAALSLLRHATSTQ